MKTKTFLALTLFLFIIDNSSISNLDKSIIGVLIVFGAGIIVIKWLHEILYPKVKINPMIIQINTKSQSNTTLIHEKVNAPIEFPQIKIIKIKHSSIPINQAFDPIKNPKTPSKKEILFFLLTPDKLDGIFVLLSVALALIITRPFTTSFYNVVLFIVCSGFILTFLSLLRWGYFGIHHYTAVQKRLIETITQSESRESRPHYVLNFKIFGICLGLITFSIGLFLI